MPVAFDFSLLCGRIIEKYGSRAAFGEAIKMSKASVSGRLNNKVAFQPEDILLICSPDVLDIPETEIGKYFFTPKV